MLATALGLVLAASAAAPTATPAATAAPVTPTASPTPGRDPLWAERLEAKGLPNFHRVSATLYRGAQPQAEGFHELKKRGIKTVVNLRSFHSDRDGITAAGLGYEHIYMKAWNAEDEEILRFLRIVTDPGRQPVFVHCQHGADRTGTMAAAYRIVVEGWDPEDAAREMVEGGYGFHAVWPNLVRYVKKIDGAKLRKELGLPDPAAKTTVLTEADCDRLGATLAKLANAEGTGALSAKLADDRRAQAEKRVADMAARRGSEWAAACRQAGTAKTVPATALDCAAAATSTKAFEDCLSEP